jgi:predicted negative regulator of RcsB-dependent stress response
LGGNGVPLAARVDGPEDMTTHTAPETASLEGALGRASRAPRHLWQVPTFFAGLLALLAVLGGAAFRRAPASEQLTREIAALREGLHQPRTPPEQMLPLAEHILDSARKDFPERAAEAHFLLGLVHARLADRSPPDRARDHRRQAQLHLAQAEAAGVAAQDLPRLHYYLGKLLYQSGGELPRIIEYLSRSTAQGADDPAEGYGMLAQAYQRLQPPDIDAALLAIQKQLENTDDETVAAQARLQRAGLLLGKGRRADALNALRSIGATAPLPVRTRARYLQARCAQEEGLYTQALPLWKELLAEPSAVPGGKAVVYYALGLCYASADLHDDARAEGAWQQAAQLGGAEGQAATLRLAELTLHGKEPGKALDWFARALQKVRAANEYQNPVLPLDAARELFEAGCRVYREGQDHERALKVAELYKRLALPGVAEEHLAQAAEARADSLMKKAGQGVDPVAASERDQALALYRQAAEAYEHAAAGRLPAEKAQRLRRGAACYLQAGDHARAAVLLRQFIDLIPEPEHKAEGWFTLAGAHRALKQTEAAQKAYFACIQYPQSPLSTRARLELAEVEIEQNNLDRAEEILQQNLALSGPSPDRQAQELSLYRLAELLYQRKKYDRAEFRLLEALRHYPHNSGALAARDMLGECYRQLAEQARLDGPERALGNDPHMIYKSVRWENLEKARQVYEELAEELEKRSAARALTASEEALLCKALLTATDCLAGLPSNFAEVVRRYSDLAKRFRGRIDGLLACQGLLNCITLAGGDLGQMRLAVGAARGAVQAAREDVADVRRMPDEAFRVGPNAPTRAQWREWLDKVAQQLDRIPTTPSPSGG